MCVGEGAKPTEKVSVPIFNAYIIRIYAIQIINFQTNSLKYKNRPTFQVDVYKPNW